MGKIGEQRGTSVVRGLVEKEVGSGGLSQPDPARRSSLVPRCFPIVPTDRGPGTG